MTDTPVRPSRPTTLEIDLDAAANNVHAVRELVTCPVTLSDRQNAMT